MKELSDLLAKYPQIALLIILALVAIAAASLLAWLVLRRRERARTAARPGAAPQAPGVPPAPGEPALPPPAYGLQLVDAGGRVIPLQLPASIGRGKDNQVVLDDESVSPVHARIYYDELAQAVCVEDCDSGTGVFVDEHPTRKNVLRSDCSVTFGRKSFRYVDQGYIPATH